MLTASPLPTTEHVLLPHPKQRPPHPHAVFRTSCPPANPSLGGSGGPNPSVRDQRSCGFPRESNASAKTNLIPSTSPRISRKQHKGQGCKVCFSCSAARDSQYLFEMQDKKFCHAKGEQNNKGGEGFPQKEPEQSIYYCDPELSTDRCVKN